MNIKGLSILLISSHAGQSAGCHARWSFSSTGGQNTMQERTAGFNVKAGGTTTCRVSNCAAGGYVTLELAYDGIPYSGGSHGYASQSAGINGGTIPCDLSLTLSDGGDASSLGVRMEVITVSDITVDCTCSGGGVRGIAGDGGCFSATSSVQVDDKGIVQMENLQIGDKVLTGSNKYQPVYSFGHVHESMKETFYQLYTGAGTPLELTGNHMVFVSNGKSTKATRADGIQVGDKLVRDSKSVAVTKISTTQKKGLYMPLTADGTIVVDGILTSNYVSIQKEAPTVVGHSRFFIAEDKISHWWMAPYRVMCMGISPNFCKNESRNNEGILQWLLLGSSFAEFAEKQNFFVRVFVLGFPTFFLFGVLNFAEALLGGAALAPLVVLALIGAASWLAKKQQNMSDKKKMA